MTRRRFILLLALIIATIVYVPVFFAMLRRTMFVLFPTYGAGGRVNRHVPDDLFGLPPLIDGYNVYGFFVPLWMVVALWCTLPATWAGFELFYKLRRHRRDKLGRCLECGHHLTSHRGHCPGCGTRIGPGLPTRRYVLNMPRNV